MVLTKTAADGLRLAEHETAPQIAERWLASFAAATASAQSDAVATLVADDVYWRDILALTFDIRTFAGKEEISTNLVDFARDRQLSEIVLDAGSVKVVDRGELGTSVEALFAFETDIGLAQGHVRLNDTGNASGDWCAWTLFTALKDLKGHEEKIGSLRPNFVESTIDRAKPWMTAEEHSAYYETHDPDTVIIGGAQTGLALAARLGAMDVPALVIDKEPRIGDVWRNRYASLVLHNQVWANHLPHLPFPASWPVYITKDQLAEWLEIYTRALSIATWTATTLEASVYDEAHKRWTLTLRRGDGTTSVVRPRNVVLATGVFGGARRIDLPGADLYSGHLIYAAEFCGALDVAGKRALVVGSGASAHDVSQELNAAGASVTMLQRGSTCIISLDPGTVLAYSAYNENGPPAETVDLISDSIPHPVLVTLHKEMTKKVMELDKELIEGLNRAGFATNNGEDDSGFLTNFHRRGGGYYINVGTSDLIVSGQIKVKHGTTIAGFEGRTVQFADGSAADYDVVVIAAGYENMQESVRTIMGDAIADKVGPVWGMDEHHELRAMWKRTGQEGFWIAGGSLRQNRSFSKYLALQIKARAVGLIA
jgi:cation diffusion facilitator CzcD-associated flavoprotein CzcO/ketosteroid isomerase-like protein